MLALFYKKKDHLKNFTDEYLIQILQFLNDSLERKKRPIHKKKKKEYYYTFKQIDPNFFDQESDIKIMIKSLPIFRSILDKTDNILNKTAYDIQAVCCMDGLDIFCEANDIFLIDSKCKFDKLYKYLEVNLTLDEFYIKFLGWASTLIETDFLKQHLIIIKNNFGIENEKIFELISHVRFVNTNGTYKRVNEFYNHENGLFKICFSHLYLPEEFSSEENWPVWKDFMLKLGLKNNISMDDYLKTANTLKTYFHSKQIKMNGLMKYVNLMFKEVTRFKKENQMEILLEKLKLIEFIPNCYHYGAPPIKLNIIFKDLVCIKDSYFKTHEHFVWLTHDILPDFCKEALSCSENYYKIAGIHYELDSDHLIKNFQKLIVILKEKDSLNNTNIDELKKYVDLMFKEIARFKKENQMETLLGKLKLIEFIPNYFTDEDLFQIHQFINDSLERIQNLQLNEVNQDHLFEVSDIKNIIKSLPIFKSILNKTENIINRTVFLIEKQAILSMYGLDLFCVANNIFLVDSKCNSLYDNLEAKYLSFDEFCIKYFSWSSTLEKFDFLKNLKNLKTFKNIKSFLYYYIIYLKKKSI
jgi:hypothetical protein